MLNEGDIDHENVVLDYNVSVVLSQNVADSNILVCGVHCIFSF